MKKKVLFVINTLRDGGAEKVLVDILNNIDQKQFDVTLMLIIKRGQFIQRLDHGINLKCILDNRSKFMNKVVSWLLPRLPSEILHFMFIRGKYDTEVAFLEGYATKIVAGAGRGVNRLAWIHSDLETNDWIAPVFHRFSDHINCYRKFKTILCVSEEVRKAFVRKYGITDKAVTVYNPVNCTLIERLSKIPIMNRSPLSSDIKLLAIGRLVEQKGFQRLLRVTKRLIDDGFVNFELMIIGEGEQRNEIEEYMHNYGLDKHVRLMGFLQNPYQYMVASHWLICSSIAEGFSTVATEATVLGLPTITTDCAGMRELFGDNEYGMIVDNDDESLYEGIRDILSHPEKRDHYAKKAIEKGETFDFRKSMETIVQILK